MLIDEISLHNELDEVTLKDKLKMMMDRVGFICNDDFTDETLVELIIIFNNISYVFLYLEANENKSARIRLKEEYSYFYSNIKLDMKILNRLLCFNTKNNDIDISKKNYIDQITYKIRDKNSDFEKKCDAIKKEIENEYMSESKDKISLLQSLNITSDMNTLNSIFYTLLSRLEKKSVRKKLYTKWKGVELKHADFIEGKINEMFKLRLDNAIGEGFNNTLEKTLKSSNLSESEINSFLYEYLKESSSHFNILIEELKESLNDEVLIERDFPAYMKKIKDDSLIPNFQIDECLRHLFRISKVFFDLEFSPIKKANDKLVFCDVFINSEKIGRINFDLWSKNEVNANYTLGIRNKSNWLGEMHLPEAYICCKFIKSGEKELISFQNVHSLYHEFGHAINHILLKGRIANQTGLEYLPLERVECLSMWFEKWCFHSSFVTSMSCEDSSIEKCQEMKKIEYQRSFLEKSVLACLDFICHKGNVKTLKDAYNYLDKEFGISEQLPLSNVLPYFTWPMFMAYPGAHFSYLWGTAFSTELHNHYINSTLDELSSSQLNNDCFESCFDYTKRSKPSAINNVFKFYDPRR